MLNTIIHGEPTSQPPLLIAHGLFGSARNWGAIGKRLSKDRQVIAVDMRNHGQSPWYPSHSYADQARDLSDVIEALVRQVDVLGHSMGGKAAMVLATERPENINKLIVADIAPVAYRHSQNHVIDAMQAVDLAQVDRRADAAVQMRGVDDGLKAFLLQSLDIAGKRWRLNLPVLRRDMTNITGFPQVAGQFSGSTLFLTGANSDYVQPSQRPRMKELFPAAKFAKIPDAGHWLHAEKPREFEAAVREFLRR